MMTHTSILGLSIILATNVLASNIQSFKVPYETQGSIERYTPEFDELVSPDAQIEILATGFRWSEGPLWDKAKNRLLFTDVPNNTAYIWTESDGVSIFLQPSGHAEMQPEGVRSPGANGLAFSPDGQLTICQHGNRQIVLYDDTTQALTTLVDRYGDQEFYSPNDLVYATDGTLFFTDPPYGLMREERLAITTHYVYRHDTDGSVHQIIDTIKYPNGIALSPDETTLYVAISDRATAGIQAFALDESGNLIGTPRTFFDATTHYSDKRKGVCDGMAIDPQGNVWATGPGGVYIIAPDGKLLGFLNTESRLANCTFGGPDDATLYITAADKLLRIQTKVTAVEN